MSWNIGFGFAEQDTYTYYRDLALEEAAAGRRQHWLFLRRWRAIEAEGGGRALPPECSMCRRRHGPEIQHACE